MKKIKSEEKEVKEYTKEEENYSKIKQEALDFLESSKVYIKDVVKLYSSFFKKIYEKLSFMLSEELGESEATYKRRAKLFIMSLFLMGVGVFISATEFIEGSFPVSLVLISSAGLINRERSAFTPRLIIALTLISVVLSTLFMKEWGLVYFTVIITVFIMRSVVTRGNFDESIGFRTLTSFGSALLLSSFQMIIDAFIQKGVIFQMEEHVADSVRLFFC